MGKSAVRSRTIIVGVLTFLSLAIPALLGSKEFLELVQDHPRITLGLASLGVLVVTALRFVTTEQITSLFVWFAVAIGFSFSGFDLAHAGEVAVVLDDSRPGTFLVTVGADGSIAVNPIRVVRPGPPGPPPVPTVLTDRAKAIKNAADAITGDTERANTAQSLAVLYREIAKLTRQAGAVKDEPALANGLKVSTDTLLSRLGVGPNWLPVRDKLGTYWTVLRSRSAPITEYGVLLDEAADGLEASAPQRAISPELRKFIFEVLLPLLLKLLLPV